MIAEEKIISYVNNFVRLNDDEAIEFSSAFKKIKVIKRQFLIQPNFIAKSRYFIINGSVRAYVAGDEGQDHTIQLAIEDWWISDYDSYIHQLPARMFVVAMEDSVLLQLTRENEIKLKESNPKFETFFRTIAERSLASVQRRLICNLTKSAEDRYESFVKWHPEIAFRFPQYAIASYLGMTTEFLSKIKNQKVRGKT